MIRVTEIEADLESMLDTLGDLMQYFERYNQVGVTARIGVSEPLYDSVGWIPDGFAEGDYSEITEPFRGTTFETFLKALPFKYGRTRLMRMRPKSCLSIHADPAPRYHLALSTNPACYIIGVSGAEGLFYHIPADGRLYEMDAHKMHTAMNSSREDRIHLVVCPADSTRPDDAEPIGRRIL